MVPTRTPKIEKIESHFVVITMASESTPSTRDRLVAKLVAEYRQLEDLQADAEAKLAVYSEASRKVSASRVECERLQDEISACQASIKLEEHKKDDQDENSARQCSLKLEEHKKDDPKEDLSSDGIRALIKPS
jgi:hypothetical protein